MPQITLAGNSENLPELIVMADVMNQLLQEMQGGGGTSRPLPVDVKGKIYIKLYFRGNIVNSAQKHSVEKSFRLMKDDPTKITEGRLKALAQVTASKFKNFTFNTGIRSYTYNVPEQGFSRIWGHFKAEADAKKLFEQMLDIDGLSPNWKRLSCSYVPSPGDRFSSKPDKVLSAGVSIRPDMERPTALVKFNYATIKFPHIRKELLFAGSNGQYPDVFKEIQKLAKKN